jgi:hypothetical protein
MRKSWLLCVLMGTLAWGQAQSARPPQAVPAPGGSQGQEDTSASVAPDAPVITITGVCDTQPPAAAAAGECKTVITKAQFEKLATAIAPNATPLQKKQISSALPRIIAYAAEARKQGMDKTEQFDEVVGFAKMQILQNQLQRKIQEDSANISDADIEKYYHDNAQNFEQYNIDRIFVPRTKQAEPEAADDDDKNEKLSDTERKAKEAAEKAKTQKSEVAMANLADDLRTRAAAGGDVVSLQKEAFEKAGMKIESPNVNLPTVRRSGLPPGHAAAFDLKPGEVSKVISDAGGHYIYKMNSSTQLPLDQVKNEIHSKLQQDRMREKTEQLNSSFKAETNEAYFGPATASPMPPPRMPRPRPGTPSGPGAQPQTPPAAPQKN